MAQDPAIDVVIPLLTMSPAEEIRSVAAFSATSEKPVAILWTGGAIDELALVPETLVAQGHAVYRDAMPCLKAVRASMRYGEFRARLDRAVPSRPSGVDLEVAKRMLAGMRGTLSEVQSKALLRCYGLPLTRESLAGSADEAVHQARELGRPVALKIQSPDIAHKTEAKAIRLGISGDEAVRRAYEEVLEAGRAYRPDARIEGVLVQEMVSDGEEVLLGVARDPTFGPVITVGLGGIYVEVLKDVALRLPPVDSQESMEMLRELRMYPLLAGARGRAPADIEALARCIERVSWLAVDLQDRIAELDINPLRVLAEGQGVRVVDALVVTR
jgi:acetyltransferase